jgi:hypothetical protein
LLSFASQVFAFITKVYGGEMLSGREYKAPRQHEGATEQERQIGKGTNVALTQDVGVALF